MQRNYPPTPTLPQTNNLKLSAVLVGRIKESEGNQSKNASDPAWVGEQEAAIIHELGEGQSSALLCSVDAPGCSSAVVGRLQYGQSTAALLPLGGSWWGEDGAENGSLQLVNASLSRETPVPWAGSSEGMFCAWAASLLKWHVLKML